jgi:hypothetical protein
MREITDGLDCDRHPAMALIVTIDVDGVVHTHRHCTFAEMTAALGDLVDQCRADLLKEVQARGDLS